MTCTATSTALAGHHADLATVVGTPPVGTTVSATDPANYSGKVASISLEKRVNGEDADSEATAVRVLAGSSLAWTFTVVNTGEVTLASVVVTDPGHAVTCPKTTLAPSEAMTCTAASTLAEAGHHLNVATVSGTPAGAPAVEATDPAHYVGLVPGLTLEKTVNDCADPCDQLPGLVLEDFAAVPDDPNVVDCPRLKWRFIVTNVGEVPLYRVRVVDPGHPPTCPKSTLAVGETMTCWASDSDAKEGGHCNVATAEAALTAEAARTIAVTDPACYTWDD
jgi:hypothetical protein